MKTRPLGSAGPQLTMVGLGTWAMGGPWKFGWGQVDDDDSVATIQHAVERGVNWIDTAPVYGLGHSEEVVGRGREAVRAAEDVYLFTKCGLVWDGLREGEVGNDLSRRVDPPRVRGEPAQAGGRADRPVPVPLAGLHDGDADRRVLGHDGGVGRRGQGAVDRRLQPRRRAARAREADRHVDSLQPPLSMLVRGTRSELLPWADGHGIGVIVYSPMASGMLTGAFDRDRVERLDPNDWRRGSPIFQEPLLSANLALIDGLRAIAARVGSTVPCLAVGWVLAQQGVTGAIVGARRPAQVDSWSPAGEGGLGDDVLQEIDGLIAASGVGTDERPSPPPHMRPEAPRPAVPNE